MNQKNAGNVVVFVLLAGLVVASIIYFGKHLKTSPDTQVIPTPTASLNIPEVLNPLLQKAKTTLEETKPDLVEFTDKGYVWWVSNDGFNIINAGAYGVSAKYDCRDYPQAQKEFESKLKPLEKTFPEFMKGEGFTKDFLNSSTSLLPLPNYDQFYDYVQAYRKDQLRCTLTANPDCTGSDPNSKAMWYETTFACTQDFQKNYNSQTPFLKDLGIKNSVVTISKQVDNYALLSVHGRRAGGLVIAMNENGVWKELFSGQESPDCKIVDQFNVPKEIYETCYTDSLNLR